MKIAKKILFTLLYFVAVTIISFPAIVFAGLMIGFNDSGAALTWVDCLQITLIVGGMLITPPYLAGFLVGVNVTKMKNWFLKSIYLGGTVAMFVLLFIWYVTVS